MLCGGNKCALEEKRAKMKEQPMLRSVGRILNFEF